MKDTAISSTKNNWNYLAYDGCRRAVPEGVGGGLTTLSPAALLQYYLWRYLKFNFNDCLNAIVALTHMGISDLCTYKLNLKVFILKIKNQSIKIFHKILQLMKQEGHGYIKSTKKHQSWHFWSYFLFCVGYVAGNKLPKYRTELCKDRDLTPKMYLCGPFVNNNNYNKCIFVVRVHVHTIEQ